MDRKGTVRLGKGKKARAKRGKVALMALFCAYTFTACGNKEQTSIYDFAGVEPKEIDPWVYLVFRQFQDKERSEGGGIFEGPDRNYAFQHSIMARRVQAGRGNAGVGEGLCRQLIY